MENGGIFIEKSNEDLLIQLIKKYCEVKTLPKANSSVGKDNLVQIKDGHDEFATLAQLINILWDEQVISPSERSNGLARVRRRKDLLSKFLNKAE
ncbi:hypothetical protein ACQ5RO_01560 [Limosilactobacillus fermentum]|uniref:hypothetical protein n=1 Tax=Limosilactobacillus fermentum TaxID=1613 RepID=UPI0006BA282C|nr:hypothetical protein AN630_07365 [Limosilactobacillus fermentum]